MRISKRFTWLGAGALLAALIAMICVLFLSGCGNHKRRHYNTQINLDKPIQVDEFIGTLGVCWPKDWTEQQKADGRRGILAHLTAVELELKLTLKPGKLVVLLSADRLGGIDLQDRSIILIWPGECYEFPALTNLLFHHQLGDPKELDPRWPRWNALGAKIAAELKALCLVTHPPTPEPTPEPTPSPSPSPEPTPEPTPDPDPDLDEECLRAMKAELEKCHKNLYLWVFNKYGEDWWKHWWKHWYPHKNQCPELLEALEECLDGHDHED